MVSYPRRYLSLLLPWTHPRRQCSLILHLCMMTTKHRTNITYLEDNNMNTNTTEQRSSWKDTGWETSHLLVSSKAARNPPMDTILDQINPVFILKTCTRKRHSPLIQTHYRKLHNFQALSFKQNSCCYTSQELHIVCPLFRTKSLLWLCKKGTKKSN
jgi:hypothetical protein